MNGLRILMFFIILEMFKVIASMWSWRPMTRDHIFGKSLQSLDMYYKFDKLDWTIGEEEPM